MSFLGKKNQNAFLGDGYYDTDPLTTAQNLTPSDAPTTPSHTAPGGIELKVATPKQFDEVSTIADYLLSGCTVFLNVEDTPKEIIRRLIDFLSGVVYSIEGQIRKVTLTTYIITPGNVEISEADATEQRPD
ncbi:MAG: cell division protein SepF [Clostridia bacterium]|nr:cell division protein SepF [Clostridia bacterium]